jgi:hemerythrin
VRRDAFSALESHKKEHRRILQTLERQLAAMPREEPGAPTVGTKFIQQVTSRLLSVVVVVVV